MTTSEQTPLTAGQVRRLFRSRRQRILGGVCGGLAEHFHLDVILVRVLWFFFTLMGGAGVLAYVVMWMMVPPDPSHEIPSWRNTGSTGAGILLIILGLVLLFAWPHWLGHLLSTAIFWVIIPGLLLAIGLGLLLGLLLTRARDGVAGVQSQRGPLYRARSKRMLAGVCAGLARYFNLDPTVVRLLWCIPLASLGLALLIYVVMILVVPEEPFT